MSKMTRFFAYFLLFLTLSSAAVTAHKSDCAYTIVIKTADESRAGTDAKIKITLGDFRGKSVHVLDLEKWGIMGSDYDYYERGNTDLFSGRDTCLRQPVCRLKLESDAKGESPGWKIDYVDVTTVIPDVGCKQTRFQVNKWLGVEGKNELSIVHEECIDYLKNKKKQQKQSTTTRSLVKGKSSIIHHNMV